MRISCGRQRSIMFISFLLLIVLSHLAQSNVLSSNEQEQPKSYYEILDVSDTCTLSDIKKAYRKLALMYHPDRVPKEKKEESTIKFRQVSEAYEVLNDKNRRAEYDRSLKYNSNSQQYHRNHNGYSRNFQRRYHHHDPFKQFDDLFRNDPFFADAFKGMDDLFSKTFFQQEKKAQQKKGWGGWLLDTLVDKVGVDIKISTSTSTNSGTSYSHSTYGRHSSPGSYSSRSGGTYTSKSTRTIIENGRRITVQSTEKDGNRIEEKYEDKKLIQRLVNGVPQNVGRIEGGGDL